MNFCFIFSIHSFGRNFRRPILSSRSTATSTKRLWSSLSASQRGRRNLLNGKSSLTVITMPSWSWWMYWSSVNMKPSSLPSSRSPRTSRMCSRSWYPMEKLSWSWSERILWVNLPQAFIHSPHTIMHCVHTQFCDNYSYQWLVPQADTFQYFITDLYVQFKKFCEGKSTLWVGNPCGPHPPNNPVLALLQCYAAGLHAWTFRLCRWV